MRLYLNLSYMVPDNVNTSSVVPEWPHKQGYTELSERANQPKPGLLGAVNYVVQDGEYGSYLEREYRG